MSLAQKYSSMWAMLDIIFVFLLAVLFQYIVVLSILKTEESPPSLIDRNQYVIKMEWPPGMSVDMDLWVLDPTGSIVGYSQKEGNGVHLQRDDLGDSNDTVTLTDGSVKRSPLNEEVINIREFIPGRYFVNAHVYRNVHDEAPEVKVQLTRVTPFVEYVGTPVVMSVLGTERTMMTFDLLHDGEVKLRPAIQHKFVATRRHGNQPPPPTE